eukprot:sb/3471369/
MFHCTKVRFKLLDLRFLEFRISLIKYNMQCSNFQESQVKSFETHFTISSKHPLKIRELTETSKQPIRARYLSANQGPLFRDSVGSCIRRYSFKVFDRTHIPSCSEEGFCKPLTRRTEFTRFKKIITLFLKLLGIFHVLGYISCYQIQVFNGFERVDKCGVRPMGKGIETTEFLQKCHQKEQTKLK